MRYFDCIDKRKKEYFKILTPEFPEWLHKYIDTKEMLFQQYISVSCGTIYSKLYPIKYFYSSLDHSIGVALIIWHFTHDKKQTLAGLFHDIATPAFKHCIDFLKCDYINQESTELKTKEIILNSKEIMQYLNKDNIKLCEVSDYHIYPIADNDTPKLSADRLEYSLSNAIMVYDNINIQTIQKIYNDITILKNEEDIIELGFKNIEIAKEFVKITTKLSIKYREDKTRYSMQLIADIIKGLIADKIIDMNDLYKLKETELIDVIKKSKYAKQFNLWKNATTIQTDIVKPKNCYFVNILVKIRYINPLVIQNNKHIRISDIDKEAKEMIEYNLSYNMNKYIYIEDICF